MNTFQGQRCAFFKRSCTLCACLYTFCAYAQHLRPYTYPYAYLHTRLHTQLCTFLYHMPEHMSAQMTVRAFVYLRRCLLKGHSSSVTLASAVYCWQKSWIASHMHVACLYICLCTCLCTFPYKCLHLHLRVYASCPYARWNNHIGLPLETPGR